MKIVFLDLAHPRLHCDSYKLACGLSAQGNDVHLVSMRHKRLQSETNEVTVHSVGNIWGDNSGALFFDARTKWSLDLLAVFTKNLMNVSHSVRRIVNDLEPDLIITNGILSLSVIGILNEHMLLSNVVVPWIHYIDYNYKYGLVSDLATRSAASDLLKKYIRQPDALWANTSGNAHRVQKDYSPAISIEVVSVEGYFQPQVAFEQSESLTKLNILYDGREPQQVLLLRQILENQIQEEGISIAIKDVAPAYLSSIVAAPRKIPTDAKIESAAIAKLPKLTTLRSLARQILRPSKTESVDLNQEEVQTETKIDSVDKSNLISFCSQHSIPALGGLNSINNFSAVGKPAKRAILLSLLSKHEFAKAIVDYARYAHVNYAIVLNGDISKLSKIPHSLKKKTTTAILHNPKELSALLAEAVETVRATRPKISKYEDTFVVENDSKLKAALDELGKITAPADNNGPLKVFHGLTGSAGQPWMHSQAQRRLGVHADSFIVGPNYFNYGVHKHFTESTNVSSARVLAEIGKKYNVAHFYFRSLFYDSKTLNMPACLDLLSLRAAGKIVIMNFRGSEIRLQRDFEKMNPYNYIAENPPAVAKFPDEIQRKYLNFARAICNEIVVIDEELGSFAPDAKVIPRAFDFSDWQFEGLKNKQNPLVVHAPTKADIKGTASVLEAVKRLKSEGLSFDFEIVQGANNAEAKEVYKKADIIIDQLRIGWYGVLTIEAMALGKAVICYIRPDLVKHFPNTKRPFCIADPDSITDELRVLVQDHSVREGYSKRGNAFAKKTHDADKVAKMYLDLYEEARRNPKPVDLVEVFNFIQHQERSISGETEMLVEKIKERIANSK